MEPLTARDPLIQEFFPRGGYFTSLPWRRINEKERESEEGGGEMASHCGKITYGRRNVTISILRMQREILGNVPKRSSIQMYCIFDELFVSDAIL